MILQQKQKYDRNRMFSELLFQPNKLSPYLPACHLTVKLCFCCWHQQCLYRCLTELVCRYFSAVFFFLLDTLAGLWETDIPELARYGWIMFSAEERRGIFSTVHTTAGAGTTVDITRTWLSAASAVITVWCTAWTIAHACSRWFSGLVHGFFLFWKGKLCSYTQSCKINVSVNVSIYTAHHQNPSPMR